MVYIYDVSGSPTGMMYRKDTYDEDEWDLFWFEKNLQGDIVAIYDSDGTQLVSYKYTDAWGAHTVSYISGGASTGAAYNPFRYRGYYYDSDLGMYYLQSRYYDPVICRFINADGYVSTGQDITGYNMFAYCGNNPVMRVDPNGEGWIIATIVVLVLAFSLSGCSQGESSEKATAEDLYKNTNITPEPETVTQDTPESISIAVDISNYHGLSGDKDMINELTNLLANDIESRYGSFLDESKIDRGQLFGEIKLHMVAWDCNIATSSTDVINLDIYRDGSVRDDRLLVNFGSWLYSGGYNE